MCNCHINNQHDLSHRCNKRVLTVFYIKWPSKTDALLLINSGVEVEGDILDRFIPWAVLDVAVGRFGSCHGPFWTYRKFTGRFGRGRFGSWVVLVLTRNKAQEGQRHDNYTMM